ncbi:MAG: hypothetical protein AB7I48_28695 [Planctomycetaceae bacterium]
MTRSQGRKASRRQFVEFMNELFPPQSCARFAQHGNGRWSAQRVLWVSIVMNWLPGKTMAERFCAARKLVKFVHPRWTLPSAWSGFVEAQQRCWPLLWPMLCRRLRPDESFGAAWRVSG